MHRIKHHKRSTHLHNLVSSIELAILNASSLFKLKFFFIELVKGTE